LLLLSVYLPCSHNPIPLVLDDSLYTADDIKRVQEIATHFNTMFPPQPVAMAEAYVYSSKKELSQKLNAVASPFGFVISNSSGNKFCCSRAQAEAGQVAKSQSRTASIPEGKRRKVTTTRCGCLFCIHVSVVTKTMSRNLDVPVGYVRINSTSTPMAAFPLHINWLIKRNSLDSTISPSTRISWATLFTFSTATLLSLPS
jgi:hypothetical protein